MMVTDQVMSAATMYELRTQNVSIRSTQVESQGWTGEFGGKNLIFYIFSS